MSRSSVKPRLGMYEQPKPFWLFSVLQSIALVATAYLVAVFSYLVIDHICDLPHGPLWDDSFRGPLEFVLIVVTTTAFLIPYFQKEWDRGMRTFSIFTALFLLAFASLSAKHAADPRIPLLLISRFMIEPLRHLLNL